MSDDDTVEVILSLAGPEAMYEYEWTEVDYEIDGVKYRANTYYGTVYRIPREQHDRWVKNRDESYVIQDEIEHIRDTQMPENPRKPYQVIP